MSLTLDACTHQHTNLQDKGFLLAPFLTLMFKYRIENPKQFEKIVWKVSTPTPREVVKEPEKRRPMFVRPASGIRQYVNAADYPFLLDIRCKPSQKEMTLQLQKAKSSKTVPQRPATAMGAVGGRVVETTWSMPLTGGNTCATRPKTAGLLTRPTTAMRTRPIGGEGAATGAKSEMVRYAASSSPEHDGQDCVPESGKSLPDPSLASQGSGLSGGRNGSGGKATGAGRSSSPSKHQPLLWTTWQGPGGEEEEDKYRNHVGMVLGLMETDAATAEEHHPISTVPTMVYQ